MNRRYQMTTPFVPKNINQSVAVMDKLILMIAMLKMQVSQNGLKVNVTKYFSIKPLNSSPHSWGFLFIKWCYFHYRYTDKVLFIDDSEPALGAGGREFESLHPDRRENHSSLIKPSRNRGLCVLSYLFIIIH